MVRFKLSLGDLPISDNRKSVINSILIKDNMSLLLILERYKLMSRDILVRFLNMYQTLNVIDKSSRIYFRTVDEVSSELTPLEQKICEKHNVLLIKGNGFKSVSIVMNPWDYSQIEQLEMSLAMYSELNYVYVTPSNLEELQGYYFEEYNFEVLFKRLLVECLERKGSDMHFGVRHSEVEPTYYVAFREGNNLVDNKLFHLTARMNEGIINTIIKNHTSTVTSDLNLGGIITKVLDPLGDGGITLRLSANKCEDGFMYVFRIQTLSTSTLRIDELGFEPDVEELLHLLSKQRSGLTLITGSIRSGKNTTATAIGRELPFGFKVTEYSSPVEILMPYDQIDYDDNIPRLVNYISAAKKQDLNVAFLNEIPNKDVAFAVRDLVNSSVHVVTTMHINMLWHLPHKLFEYFGDSYRDVLTQVNGVVNQKMYVCLCDECKYEILTENVKDKYIRELLIKHGVSKVMEKCGCANCNEGLTRLQPVVECLRFTDDIKHELLKLDRPYLMEDYIRNLLIESKQSLEYKLIDKIKQGKLHYSCLYDIV